MPDEVELLKRLYDRFNARDMETLLSAMQEDVIWANGMEGGHVHGREGVRSYWTRQWAMIDPHVEPVEYSRGPEGEVHVEVRSIVRDRNGNLLADQLVGHVFRLANGLVQRFDIQIRSAHAEPLNLNVRDFQGWGPANNRLLDTNQRPIREACDEPGPIRRGGPPVSNLLQQRRPVQNRRQPLLWSGRYWDDRDESSAVGGHRKTANPAAHKVWDPEERPRSDPFESSCAVSMA
jgi:hypothetical protein